MALAENKRAYFDYEILEEIEAGIELRGFEVKAIRSGKMSIVGSYAIIRGGEVYLVGVDIAPYQPGNEPSDYEANRTIKIILHKKEINHLEGKTKERGLTLVPIRVYDKNGLIKILIGLAKKKKKYDKREQIIAKEVDQKIKQKLKTDIRG